jgi:hypothetical protein
VQATNSHPAPIATRYSARSMAALAASSFSKQKLYFR